MCKRSRQARLLTISILVGLSHVHTIQTRNSNYVKVKHSITYWTSATKIYIGPRQEHLVRVSEVQHCLKARPISCKPDTQDLLNRIVFKKQQSCYSSDAALQALLQVGTVVEFNLN